MKAHVSGDRDFEVGGSGKLFDDVVKRRELSLAGTGGGEAGVFRLDHETNFGQLAKALGLVWQGEFERSIQRFVQSIHGARALALANLQQALLLQALGGFANDAAAHAQLGGEVALRGQPVAVALRVVSDELGESLTDFLHERWRSGDGVDSHGSVVRWSSGLTNYNGRSRILSKALVVFALLLQRRVTLWNTFRGVLSLVLTVEPGDSPYRGTLGALPLHCSCVSVKWAGFLTMVRSVGRHTLSIVHSLGDFALFVVAAFRSAFGSRKLLRRVTRAMFEQGVRCLPVILIVGLFTGLVLGLQGYYVLNRFGSESLLGTLVSLSIVRELGPVLAALMLVGQAGSALAAELGIQRNTEQIAALETMGVSSHAYLVAPRLIASLMVYPMQTALFCCIGLWGGSVSGSMLLSLEPGVYWSAVERAIEAKDMRECLAKAFVFGLLTIGLCAYHGFNAHRNRSATGARAVSASTTRAVVQSSIIVLAADYVITSFLV